MGFRRNIGATIPCRLKDGYLEIQYPNPVRIKTSLDITTDWQRNFFTGSRVYWLVIVGDELYYGLEEGTVMVTKADGTVVAIHEWSVPIAIRGKIVGYMNAPGEMNEMVLDGLCDRVVHASLLRRTFVLKDGVSVNTPTEGELAGMLRDALVNKVNAYPIMSFEGGVDVADSKYGEWGFSEDLSAVRHLQFR